MTRKIRIDADSLKFAVIQGDTGFCRVCGDQRFGVEPDAMAAKCEKCGRFTVAGIETLVTLDLVEITQEVTQ
jgi:hypothetical protein